MGVQEGPRRPLSSPGLQKKPRGGGGGGLRDLLGVTLPKMPAPATAAGLGYLQRVLDPPMGLILFPVCVAEECSGSRPPPRA